MVESRKVSCSEEGYAGTGVRSDASRAGGAGAAHPHAVVGASMNSLSLSRRRTKWSNRRPPRGVEPRALSTVRPTGWPGQQVSFVRPQCQTSCLDIVGQVDFQLQSERGSAASSWAAVRG